MTIIWQIESASFYSSIPRSLKRKCLVVGDISWEGTWRAMYVIMI
jgi:hypothetical protein